MVKISWSLEASRFDIEGIFSLQDLADDIAAELHSRLPFIYHRDFGDFNTTVAASCVK